MTDRASATRATALLAITIPTYNRADLLGHLLQSIARDFERWPDDLELIVIDNASTDHTRKEVERYQARGVPIRLITNERNIGMDGNLAACFGVSQAKYLWQIGDDEVLHQGCAGYVLDFCRQRNFGLLHIECVGFSKGGQLGQLARKIPDDIRVRELDSARLFRQANIYLTFISSNVINRHAVLASQPTFDGKTETGTFLPQLAWIYGALKASDCHFHVRTPLFGALGGNTSGYRLVEVFGRNLLTITTRQLGDRLPQARTVMANAVLTRLLPGELVSLAKADELVSNRFETENLSRALDEAFGSSLYLRWCTKPLLSTSPARRWQTFFGVRVFNKLNRAMNYVLL